MGINQKKFNLSLLVTGISFLLFSASAVAAEPLTGNNQFDYDVKSGIVDEAQLNQFVDAQNVHPVTFFESVETNNVIMSDAPIKHVYMASSLSDLGYAFQGDQAVKDRSSSFTLAEENLQQLPVVPDFVAPTVVAPQPAVVEKVQAKVNAAPVHQAAPKPMTAQPPYAVSPQALELIAGLLAVYTLLLIITRPSSQVKLQAFKGKLGAANEMIGRGKLFQFTNHLKHKDITNGSHMNLIWMTKHFKDRKQGETDSYFYMTFYMPPQHGYAASMQTQKAYQPEQPEIQV